MHAETLKNRKKAQPQWIPLKTGWTKEAGMFLLYTLYAANYSSQNETDLNETDYHSQYLPWYPFVALRPTKQSSATKFAKEYVDGTNLSMLIL